MFVLQEYQWYLYLVLNTVHILPSKRGKLNNVAVEMICLRYDKNSKAHLCYNATKKKVVVNRDVRFSTPIISDNAILFDLDQRSKARKAIKVHDSSVLEEQPNAHEEIETDPGDSIGYAEVA